MAKWGNCSFSELTKLKEKLESAQQDKVDIFIKQCSKELTARLLRKVVKRTLPRKPFNGNRMKYKKGANAGKYKMQSVNIGGTLRRGWTSDTHEEAKNGKGNGTVTPERINSLEVKKIGNVYRIEIINPVKYASYVEFGHRTRNHKDWVSGKFMLTMSLDEIQQIAPKLLEKRIAEFLKECFFN